MLGHLVSASPQSPPDFGIASFLRHAIRTLQAKAQRAATLVSDAAQHKQPHPQ